MSEQALHQSVLLNEVVEALGPIQGGLYLDATFGNGGYSRAILDAANCKLLAIDRDPDAIKRDEAIKNEYAGRFQLVEGCFPIWPTLLLRIYQSLMDSTALHLTWACVQLSVTSPRGACLFAPTARSICECPDLAEAQPML